MDKTSTYTAEVTLVVEVEDDDLPDLIDGLIEEDDDEPPALVDVRHSDVTDSEEIPGAVEAAYIVVHLPLDGAHRRFLLRTGIIWAATAQSLSAEGARTA